MIQDIHAHADLDFPTSLPAFQRLFPDDAACAAYLTCLRIGMKTLILMNIQAGIDIMGKDGANVN